MARIARVVIPGKAFHVVQRGNHRETIFRDDRDRQVFLSIIREYAEEYRLRIIGYCLMGNHYHIVCIPDREDSMACAFGRANSEYSRWLHIQRRQIGQLWQSRYRSCMLDEVHLWNALRYVEQNPVRAGLTGTAWQWPWSSARAHTGDGAAWLVLDDELWRTKYDVTAWRNALEMGIEEAAFIERIRTATERGRPLGSPEFVEDVERQLGRPVRPQRRGRKLKPLSASVAHF